MFVLFNLTKMEKTRRPQRYSLHASCARCLSNRRCSSSSVGQPEPSHPVAETFHHATDPSTGASYWWNSLTRQAHWEPDLPSGANAVPAAPRRNSATQPLPHIQDVYVPYADPVPASHPLTGPASPVGWGPFEVDDPWAGLHSTPGDPEPQFATVDGLFERTTHTVALYQVNQPSFGMRIMFRPDGPELGVRILETLPGGPAAVANRLAGQRFADDRAAGHAHRTFQGLSAGSSIISVMLSYPDGKTAFFDTPAAIAMALEPPRVGLTLVRVAQDLRPFSGRQPGALGQATSSAARSITRTV